MTTIAGISPHPIYLAGRWVESPDVLVVDNPARPGEPAGATYTATEAQYEEAVEAAVRAFETTRELPADERGGSCACEPTPGWTRPWSWAARCSWAARPRATSSRPRSSRTSPLHAKVCAGEAFAPLVVAFKVRDLDEAIEEVNDSAFGLRTGVFTNDLSGAWRCFEELEVGGVILNDAPTYRIDHMPYGGVKDSGLGREGLRWAIEDMTEVRIMVLAWPEPRPERPRP